MKWFRFYTEALHDPKVQRLPPVLFKHWVNILCIASSNDPRGSLPPVKDIAFILRLKTARCEVVVDSLRTAGVLDRDSDGTLRVHGWDKRQPKSDNVAERVDAYRRRQNGTSDALATRNVTLHETLQPRSRIEEDVDTDTDTEEIFSSSGEVSNKAAVVAPAAPTAAASGWTDAEAQKVARRLAGRLKIMNPDIDGMVAVLHQQPHAVPYIEAEAAKCIEWYSAKGRKVTLRLFDNWLGKAKSRQETERLQQQEMALNGKGHLNGQQQQQQQPSTEPAPTEPDALYTYHRQRAAEAEAARAKMVS